ncbi:23S ribosomal RNA methyltransferase Erm [Micrococcoides hystricis]|uniref:23S ribosomal RNA methyltransferase Erm n=1 Tax=Micrococcoides hystricis TaxID=1572761 RepID=A0ABV6PAD6_9MICC
MARSIHGGAHELGQNYLHHTATLDLLVRQIQATEGPILEIGPGRGALTTRLAGLGRTLRAVDIDEHNVSVLRKKFPCVTIEHADILDAALTEPVVVGNLPFHLTTPILRKLLTSSCWQHAIILVQWEVARKRAGVGGATMLTAQSAPWYEFTLVGRVPAQHFRPVPTVDGGVLHIHRRAKPLVPEPQRRDYQRFVKSVFTARGRGLRQILTRGLGYAGPAVGTSLQQAGLAATALPRDINAHQWARLFAGLASGGKNRKTGPSGRRR